MRQKSLATKALSDFAKPFAKLSRLCLQAFKELDFMRLFKKKRFVIKGEDNVFVSPKDSRNELLKYGALKINGNKNNVQIAAPNFLKFTDIHITGDNNTVILPANCYGKLHLDIRASNTIVQVGDKTGFMGTDIILEENNSKVIIGDDCMFAKDTKLYCSDFHSVIDSQTHKPLNQGKEIIIGNHVWLGEAVKILKNCHICNNIILAIGSIVTKDLTTEHAMFAGNPAVCKKTNIDWVHENYDLALKKWKKNHETL